MEYTEEQLSKKFPMSQLPWEDGLYEITHKDGDVFYSYFIEGAWRSGNRCIADASKESPFITDLVIRDRKSWRGLSSDPSAPKKRAGNKRKTMYVVMDANRFGSCRGACGVFEKKENAQEYAEYLDFEVRIQKIRFRTPEA